MADEIHRADLLDKHADSDLLYLRISENTTLGQRADADEYALAMGVSAIDWPPASISCYNAEPDAPAPAAIVATYPEQTPAAPAPKKTKKSKETNTPPPVTYRNLLHRANTKMLASSKGILGEGKINAALKVAFLWPAFIVASRLLYLSVFITRSFKITYKTVNLLQHTGISSVSPDRFPERRSVLNGRSA
jgi:hypothetical protein